MTAKHIHHFFVTLLVILGAGLLASVYFANDKLIATSKTLSENKAMSQAVASLNARLLQDKKDIVTYNELNTIARTVVPKDKDQAKTVREITKLAADSGIPRLSSVAFNPSTLGGAKTVTPGGLTQVTPVKDIPGVYNLGITVQQAETSQVPYANFINFLSRLEQNRRTAQVSSITVQPNPNNPGLVSFTLVINEYIKP